MTAWQYLIDLNKQCHFMSRERSGNVSNSELKRWLNNKAVIFNGERLKYDDEVVFPVKLLVLFPKKKVTII